MRWITCDEAPLDENIHMVACRFKIHFDTWRYTEAEWIGNECYIWFQQGEGAWIKHDKIKTLDTSAWDYQWLLEEEN